MVTPLLLLVERPTGPSLLPVVTLHLTALVLLGLLVAVDLSRFLHVPWFAGVGPVVRRFGTAAAVVALSTGVVALVTLASSAALRYDASLQFLQLLSALDIAWAAAALTLGGFWLWGRTAGIAASAVLIAVCVWSIWNYLRIIGFGPEEGWLVDGAALLRYVLPYDMAAAVTAIVVLILGSRRQATEQPSVQS